MVHRLKNREQELAALVFREAEKGRYRVLGEISGLIAHDLSSPLHVALFCANELNHTDDTVKRRKYNIQLMRSLTRAAELSTSLRNRLKNSPENSTTCEFGAAHTQIVQILETTYREGQFNLDNIKVDPNTLNIKLGMNRVEFTQILDNIYRNCIDNFIRNPVSNPQIEIQLISQESEKVTLSISDNGSGLSSKTFEKLTGFGFVQDSTPSESRGLGLRLTRRLIEHRGGTLEVIDRNPGESGTLFNLSIRTETPTISKADTIALAQIREVNVIESN